MPTLAELDRQVTECRACPRLVAWREEVARVKRAALHAVGLASQPTSTHIGDGLELYGVRITAPVRCAPPENKPTPAERDNCRPWLATELELLSPTLRAIVVLGAFGWQALLPVLADAGWQVPRPRPKFGHGVAVELSGPSPLHLFGCYHVSQQNTFTGKLTPAMLETVLRQAKEVAGESADGSW